MTTRESSHRGSMFIHNLTNIVIIAVILFTVAAAWKPLIWPTIQELITGTQPAAPAHAPATVATPRPLPAQVQPAPLPAAPVVQPTAYTLEDANRAADEAYRQAIQEVEQNAAPAQAATVQPISDAQIATFSNRGSGGCAPGQVFYPRSGCHTPGSGGPQPGSVAP